MRFFEYISIAFRSLLISLVLFGVGTIVYFVLRGIGLPAGWAFICAVVFIATALFIFLNAISDKKEQS